MNKQKLNVACGLDYRENCVNLESNKSVKADIYHDIEKLPLPFNENSFEVIYCNHILEHLNPKIVPKLFNEFYRILKNKGRIIIEVPYAFSHYAWADPTHFRAYTYESFNYFCSNSLQNYYVESTFILKNRYFKALGKSSLARFSAWIANLHPRLYERSFLHAIFTADAIVFELKKQKGNK